MDTKTAGTVSLLLEGLEDGTVTCDGDDGPAEARAGACCGRRDVTLHLVSSSFSPLL